MISSEMTIKHLAKDNQRPCQKFILAVIYHTLGLLNMCHMIWALQPFNIQSNLNLITVLTLKYECSIIQYMRCADLSVIQG